MLENTSEPVESLSREHQGDRREILAFQVAGGAGVPTAGARPGQPVCPVECIPFSVGNPFPVVSFRGQEGKVQERRSRPGEWGGQIRHSHGVAQCSGFRTPQSTPICPLLLLPLGPGPRLPSGPSEVTP